MSPVSRIFRGASQQIAKILSQVVSVCSSSHYLLGFMLPINEYKKEKLSFVDTIYDVMLRSEELKPLATWNAKESL